MLHCYSQQLKDTISRYARSFISQRLIAFGSFFILYLFWNWRMLYTKTTPVHTDGARLICWYYIYAFLKRDENDFNLENSFQKISVRARCSLSGSLKSAGTRSTVAHIRRRRILMFTFVFFFSLGFHSSSVARIRFITAFVRCSECE